MTDPKKISIQDYTYDLPADRIALHPLTERDASKLLVYQKGNIQEDIYRNLDNHLPATSLLVFNNSKVIRARIRFQKTSGGIIEIFLLEPLHADYTTALSARKTCTWKCLVGGAAKWKQRLQLKVKDAELSMSLKDRLSDACTVEFNWEGNVSFAEILEQCGDIPLPPYIKRKTETADTDRYQTIYARDEGSVAAPTAGLHFTDYIFSRLKEKNIRTDYVTLHVGAGTFKPVKAAVMQGHEMHAEWIDVRIEMVETLFSNLGNHIVAVGTTSLRTLESLYWMGVKAMMDPDIEKLQVSQWEVYEEPLSSTKIPSGDSLVALMNWMKKNGHQNLITQSQILIAPGYSFKIANAIITNFHQPQSTLLLLVAAAIGDEWHTIYNHALQNDFRFLSYGDGSLLFITQ